MSSENIIWKLLVAVIFLIVLSWSGISSDKNRLLIRIISFLT